VVDVRQTSGFENLVAGVNSVFVARRAVFGGKRPLGLQLHISANSHVLAIEQCKNEQVGSLEVKKGVAAFCSSLPRTAEAGGRSGAESDRVCNGVAGIRGKKGGDSGDLPEAFLCPFQVALGLLGGLDAFRKVGACSFNAPLHQGLEFLEFALFGVQLAGA
jgi:hypothetical protein